MNAHVPDRRDEVEQAVMSIDIAIDRFQRLLLRNRELIVDGDLEILHGARTELNAVIDQLSYRQAAE